MVAFVEHVAHRHIAVVDAAPGRLRHDKCVVGDHQISAPRASNGVLHIAFAPMRTGRVDTLAAPIGQPRHRARAEQLAEPTRQIAALNITITGHHRPASDQRQRNNRTRDQPAGGSPHGVFKIEQTQIVLAAFSHHHALLAQHRIGIQPRQLTIDLPLQMAGIGGDPHRRLVALRPKTGRRNIAERLAGAGAGLGKHHMRAPPRLPRCKGSSGGGGIIGLPRPLFRPRPQHRRQPGAYLSGADRQRRGRRRLRLVLPLRQSLPHPHGVNRRHRIGSSQRCQHEWRPRPARLSHPRRQSGRVPIAR